MNLFLLQLLVGGIRDHVVGRTIDYASWYRPVLTVPLRQAGRVTYLISILESPGPFCFVADQHPFAGAKIPRRLSRLDEALVTGIRLAENDRILELNLRLTGELAEAATLEIHLYGSAGRALLKRGSDVLESIGSRHSAERRGQSSTGLYEASAEDIRDAIMSGRKVQSEIPGLDNALIRFFTDDDRVDLDALIEFRDGIVAGKTRFSLDVSSRVPLPTRAGGDFENARKACATVGETLLELCHHNIVRRLAQPVRQRQTANRKLIGKLERELADASRHQQVRLEAETLAAYQTLIKPGAAEVELTDIYEPDRTIKISLDPTTPVHAQIEKRFKQATKLLKRTEHARRRLELVMAENKKIAEGMLQLEQHRELKDAIDLVLSLTREFAIIDRRNRTNHSASDRQEKTYRSYPLSDQWYVLVGRSNTENDELTFKKARPVDLWFHAQGTAGSHVLLKSRGPADSPPSYVIEMAASIAALHSKARHSELVPVIYTQRKYVRKFRGAKAGQVRCEREKMIMVRPGIPPEAGKEKGKR